MHEKLVSAMCHSCTDCMTGLNYLPL